MSEMFKYDLFLSCAKQDFFLARALADKLQQWAFTSWLSLRKHETESDWSRQLREALDSSAVCVLVFGANDTFPWDDEGVQSAIESRLERTHGEFRVIPVLLPRQQSDLVEFPTLKDNFLRSQKLGAFVRFKKTVTENEALHELILRIRGVDLDEQSQWNNEWFRTLIHQRAKNVLNMNWHKLITAACSSFAHDNEPEYETELELNELRKKLEFSGWLAPIASSNLLIGESAKLLAEINRIPLVAKCDASVLISGETGTGKELCARAIHYLSHRTFKPFVPVNCGAIPVDLVENELFGHKRGAFTGATTSEHGLIHEADGGTLFLDEINHLPAQAQVKLLRFLQEKEYRPLGSNKTRMADVRLIAATNIDPKEASQEGTIRQDLFYRLNVISLALPPLRERRDDIMLLANHFLTLYAAKFQKQVRGFSAEAKQKLLMYDWPGNVRELEHVVERAVVLTNDELLQAGEVIQSRGKSQSMPESFGVAKTKSIAQFERRYIQDLLLACEGNVTRAAVAAQRNRRALWELIRKPQIDMQSIRSLTKSNGNHS